VSAVYCQVEVSAPGRSLVQRSLVCLSVFEELHRGDPGPLGLSCLENMECV
jgi:hypothetical protein